MLRTLSIRRLVHVVATASIFCSLAEGGEGQDSAVSVAPLWHVQGELPLSAIDADPFEVRAFEVELGDLGWATQGPRSRWAVIELFDGEVETLEIQRRSTRGTDAATWSGTFGRNQDGVMLAVSGEALVATVRRDQELYRVRKLPLERGGAVVLTLLDESRFPPCANGSDGPRVPRQPAGQLEAGGPPFDPPARDGDDPIIETAAAYEMVDVLVAYTKAAEAGSGGPDWILALIDLAVLETNASFLNGNAGMVIRLVHTHQVSYAESGLLKADLYALQSKTDGKLDVVHTLRGQYGADACVLLVETGTDYCGVGFQQLNASILFKDWAFSVTKRTCATAEYVFGHELGHNFGADHDKQNTIHSSTPYGYGYRTPGNLYRTVMAYSPGTRVPMFSSPHATWSGWVMGTPDSEDNGRTLSENAQIISSWYPDVTRYEDCNSNSVDDELELAYGLAPDTDGDGELDSCESLLADVPSISVLFGGTQTLTLQAGAEHAALGFFMLGSLSGTSPGLSVDGVHVPLNIDAYGLSLLASPGAGVLSPIAGVLDEAGTATATVTLPPGSPWQLLVTKADHAYIVIDYDGIIPFVTFASEPAHLSFTLF